MNLLRAKTEGKTPDDSSSKLLETKEGVDSMPIMTDKRDEAKGPAPLDSGAAQAEPEAAQAVRTGEASGQAIRDALADAEQFDGFLFWDHPSGYQFDMMQRCRSSALRAAFGIITGEVGRAGFYARKAASDAFRAVPALRGEAK